MQNTPNSPSLVASGVAFGEYPPANPIVGTLWVNLFNTLHQWNGNFWVTVQSAAAESAAMPASRIPQFMGYYQGNAIFYGEELPLGPTPGIYWVNLDLEVKQAMEYSNHTLAAPILSWVTVPIDFRNEIIDILYGRKPYDAIPGDNPHMQPKCSPEEADEKFKDFEQHLKIPAKPVNTTASTTTNYFNFKKQKVI